MRRVAWAWLLTVAALLTLLAACGREGPDRPAQPVTQTEPSRSPSTPCVEAADEPHLAGSATTETKTPLASHPPSAPTTSTRSQTVVIRGGERPTSTPRLRDRIEVQAWSDSALIASTHLRRSWGRTHTDFQAAPLKDDPTLWRIGQVPDDATVLSLQRWTRGTVVSVAKPILLRSAEDDEVHVEWVPEEDLATVHCTARFAGDGLSRTRYVVRWNGLPLPTIDSNGFLAALRVPGHEDVEISCSDWLRANDYGLPPPKAVRQPPGTTADLIFDLPCGHRLGIRAIDARGNPVPSMVRAWRLDDEATPRPWSDSRGLHESVVPVQVLPGRYGALVQTREEGSGWREFRVDAHPEEGEVVEVPVRVAGPRLRIAIEPAEDGPQEFDVARLERVKAPSPETASFWYQPIDARTGRTFETGPLPPGDYDLALRTSAGSAWWLRRVHVTGTGTGFQEIRTRGPSTPPTITPGSSAHSVAVEVAPPDGARETGTWVILHSLDSPNTWSRARPVGLGSALFTELPVGRYRASIREGWNLPFAAASTSADVTIDGKGGQRRIRLAPARR